MGDHYYVIYPYYENPKMLEKQVENWNRFSGDLQKKITFILVDDSSPVYPAAEIFKELRHRKFLFRVKENIPWAQHHARNVGALEAGKHSRKNYDLANPWLLMSDMDIIITPEAMNDIVEKCTDVTRYHTFERNFVGGAREPKYHCNTFLVKHDSYWSINGYDCDYCGTYGGDGRFLQQLEQVAPQLHHGYSSRHLKSYVECTGDPITLFGYESNVVSDANTVEWERKNSEFHEKYRAILADKKRRGDERSKNPIRWEYDEVAL
jgi:hypothetical protein